MSELAIMDHTGDTKVIWSRENEDEVAAAKAQFQTLVGKGFAAFKVLKKGEAGEQIREFDANLEKIILVPQMQGG